MELAIESEARFIPTTTTTGAQDYRSSKVLYAAHYEPQYQVLRARLIRELPHFCMILGIPLFNPGEVESQLVAHPDGAFYKRHNDNGSPETHNRTFTYVYYFNRVPQAYTGGALRMYETANPDGYTDIVPSNNILVCFPSRQEHEVLPIRVPSGDFGDSRFAITGWIRAAVPTTTLALQNL